MVLQSVTDNIPSTPGRAVKYLKNALETKDAENQSLQATIADLTKALDSIKLVKETTVAAPAEKKGKKDKSAPKPAVTAYKYYCDDIKSAPGGDAKTAKEMQEMWKECQGDARSNYVDKAAIDKTRFEAENAEYEALQKLYQKREQEVAMALYEAHQIAAKALANNDKDGKKKKVKKDPEAPKKNKSAYLFFCDEKRGDIAAKNVGKGPTEITKILGEEWGKLQKGKAGKKGTKKYDDMAAKAKAVFEKEKAAFDAVKAEQQKALDEERATQLEMDREAARKMVEADQQAAAVQKQAMEAAMKKKTAAPKAMVPKATEPKATAPKQDKDDKPKGPTKPRTAYVFFGKEHREKTKANMPTGASIAEVTAEVSRQWGELVDKTPYKTMADNDKERYQKELAMSA